MLELFNYQLSITDLAMLLGAAFLVGTAKVGISGAGLMAVPLLALVFGGRDSTGVMLPILITADIFAVVYFHRHANWAHLLRLFPWTALGILAGTWFGDRIDDELFRSVMGFIILASLAIMVWRERSTDVSIPRGWWFAAVLGVLSGFTTMMGNLAGVFTALYLLTMRFPKNEYIGTAAWFYLVVNLSKVPLHVYIWETITWNSLLLDMIAIPAVAVGALLGIRLVRIMPEAFYRWLIIVSTALASVLMVLSNS